MAEKIEIHNSVNNKFSKYVEKSLVKGNVPKNIYVEGYLVSLLSKFLENDESFDSEEPLIFRFMQSENLEDFVKLGDETLFIMGFFPENVLKKKNKSYFVGIGKDSYICAAVKLNYKGFGSIYSTLSKNFEIYSNVINDVKYSMIDEISDEEFFQLYKNFRDYDNPNIFKKLTE